VRVERHAIGVALHPKTSAQSLQRHRQPSEVALGPRRADVDVDGGVAGVVQAGRDTADHDEHDPVLDEGSADGDDVIVVELRQRD
jgi:hypothetical protein